MADLYAKGTPDIEADPVKAAEWLKKAADQSDSNAEYKLSVMYAQGIGLPESDTDAMRLLMLSAQHGLPIAEYVAARLLEDGKKLPLDYDLSRTYYIRAAESGYQQAQVSLARGYLAGRGPLSVDKEQALFWASVAGEGHDAVAANMRAIAAGCSQTMSREAIDRVSKRIADWDRRHRS
jgi:TPR repeat protein